MQRNSGKLNHRLPGLSATPRIRQVGLQCPQPNEIEMRRCAFSAVISLANFRIRLLVPELFLSEFSRKIRFEAPSLVPVRHIV